MAKRKLANALYKQQDQARKKQRIEREEEAQRERSKRRPIQDPPVRQPWIPFEKHHSILLVGEGNFSFANALVTHHLSDDGSKVTATAFDSEDVARQKYPDIDEHLGHLRSRKATVLFSTDATALNKCKTLKGKTFDRIVFNYPHVGAGEKDETRNIRLNQALVLGFLKSAAPFLTSASSVSTLPPTSRKDRDGQIDSDNDFEVKSSASEMDPEENLKSGHYATNSTQSSPKGSLIITLRDTKPYTDWQVPLLAKKGQKFVATKDAHTQPIYELVRSGAFYAEDYPGYAHRRTIGFKEGVSTTNNEDTLYSAKHRKQGGEPAVTTKSRIWQFALKDG